MSDDTVISVLHFPDKIVASHVCLGKNDLYLVQSAGDTYNCLYRYGEIIDKNLTMYVFICASDEPQLVIVTPTSKVAPFRPLLFQKTRSALKANIVKVISIDNHLDHYHPYLHLPLAEIEPSVMSLVDRMQEMGIHPCHIRYLQTNVWETPCPEYLLRYHDQTLK